MTTRDRAFELVEFELVQAGAATVLLRVAARASSVVMPGRLTLVLHGPQVVRLRALPAPADEADPVRAAFPASVQALTKVTDFLLELADGSRVQLPQPTRRAVGVAVAVAGEEGSRLAEVEQRAEARRLAAIELERRLQAEQTRRAAAEAEVRRARSAVTTEAAARVEIRTRLAEADADIERLKAERDEALGAVRSHAAAEVALTDRVAGLELLHARVGQQTAALSDELEQAVSRAASLSQALSDALAERDAVQASLEARLATAQHEFEGRILEAQARLEQTSAALEDARAQAEASRAQAMELEAELVGVHGAADEIAAALADRTDELDREREASIARERELQAELGVLEDRLATQADEIAALEQELVAGAEAVELARREAEQAAAEQLAREREATAAAEAALAERAAEAEELRSGAFALEQELEAARAELADERERVVALEQRLADAEEAIAEAERRLAEAPVAAPADAVAADTRVERVLVPDEAALRLAAELEDALIRRGAEVELLSQALADRAARSEAAATEPAARTEAAAAEPAPREPDAVERELVELRGALERAQNRARLHRQYATELEGRLAEAEGELSTRHQPARSGGGGGDDADVDDLRRQLTYYEALAGDLKWQLEETQRELTGLRDEVLAAGGVEGAFAAEVDALRAQLADAEAGTEQLRGELDQAQAALEARAAEIDLLKAAVGTRGGTVAAGAGAGAGDVDGDSEDAAAIEAGAPDALERMTARAELHKQHATELESRLADAERALSALREEASAADTALARRAAEVALLTHTLNERRPQRPGQ